MDYALSDLGKIDYFLRKKILRKTKIVFSGVMVPLTPCISAFDKGLKFDFTVYLVIFLIAKLQNQTCSESSSIKTSAFCINDY